MKENSYHIDDELLIKYLLDEASSEERLRVEQWITAGSVNRQYYEQYKLIWEKSGRLSIPTVNEEAAWEKFLLRTQFASGRIAVKPINNQWQLLRIAALLILIVGIAGLGYFLFSDSTATMLAVRSQDSVLTDTLPDGSVVTLNKNSGLFYPAKFRVDTRSTRLQGEAFFNVSPDKRHPFLIHTNGIIIKVVGTSFNVRNRETYTEIIVETGLVQVTNQHHSILLQRGEKLTLQKDDSAMTKETVPDKLYNYYRTGEFVCDHTPLWKLVETLNEAYHTHIVIKRPALLNLPLTTIFRDESLDNILEIISKTFTITVIKSGDQIILE